MHPVADLPATFAWPDRADSLLRDPQVRRRSRRRRTEVPERLLGNHSSAEDCILAAPRQSEHLSQRPSARRPGGTVDVGEGGARARFASTVRVLLESSRASLLLPAAGLEQLLGRDRRGRDADHRFAQPARDAREHFGVVEVRRRLDDRLRARRTGSPDLKMPEPTKTPSTPNCIISAASAGVAMPPAAKLTTGRRPFSATHLTSSYGA